MLRTARALVVAALVFHCFTAPSFASSCKEDGGTRECRDLIQLPTRYDDAQLDSCPLFPDPPPTPPYFCDQYATHEAMLEGSKQKLKCGRSLCEDPVAVIVNPYVATQVVLEGFKPEFSITQAHLGSPLDNEGILLRYLGKTGNVCDTTHSEEWSNG